MVFTVHLSAFWTAEENSVSSCSVDHGLEACPVNRSQTKSLEFVLNSAFRKIFRIKSYDVADECVVFLIVQFPTPSIERR